MQYNIAKYVTQHIFICYYGIILDQGYIFKIKL